MLAAGAWAIRCSLTGMMALDELYTTTLIGTPSFAHMVDGALRGVDGNPPLYLSLAWALTHFSSIAPEAILRVANLAILTATALMLTDIGRRIADALSVAVALALLCLINGEVVYALLEIRTYALYLCLVTASFWATLAVVDRPSKRRTARLAIIGMLAALSHSFGGFYVIATISAATLTCWTGRSRDRTLALGLAALPATITTLAWISASFATQKAVATPYGWIPRPTLATLSEALTGSLQLTLLTLLALAWFAACGYVSPLFAGWRRKVAQSEDAILFLILAAYAALTIAGWFGSQLITPFFVERYFIPNVLIGAVLLIYAVAAVRRLAPPRLFAIVVPVCLLAGLAAVATGTSPTAGQTPCLTADGQFLEDGIDGDLPIVIESPHAWLPRSRYAPGRTAVYPLDWDGVLNHPYRARNNAMDFHIMEILKAWAPPGSALATDLLPTDALLARYPRFLLLDETYRGWFDELRAATPLSATLLRQSAGCRLWQIDVGPRP